MTQQQIPALLAEATVEPRLQGAIEARPGRWAREDRWLPVAAFAAIALVLVAVSQVAHVLLGPAVFKMRVPQTQVPDHLSWLRAWTWWDGAWYTEIAKRGYTFKAGPQSPVAFFPAYPMLMRWLGGVVGHPALAGFLLSMGAGLASTVLFYRWCLERLDRRRAHLALAALVLYPCSFYLTGAVYADGLFLATVMAAFVLVERDRTVWAGLVGAVATATRPTGMALVVALWVLARERRRAEPARADGRRRPLGLGLLIAPGGLVAYATFLAVRFGNPFEFAAAEKAWGQEPGLRTWLKFGWFERMQSQPYFNALHYHLVGSALVTVLAVLLLPRIYRRFGLSYALFAAFMVVGAAASTRDFTGMGRYVLVAFPLFAALGDRLAGSPRLVRPVLGTSALLLVFLTQLHARNMLIS